MMVKDLFRDAKQTEFVIATIPSVLGVNESARLAASLKQDSIPCRRIIVNQASARRRWQPSFYNSHQRQRNQHCCPKEVIG